MKRYPVLGLLMLAVVLLLPAAACGSTSNPTAKPTAARTAGPTTAPVAKTATPAPAKHTVAAAQARWDQTVAAAKQEGKLTFYGELGPSATNAIAKGFKDKYGIQVDFVTGKSPEVARKFLSEVNADLNIADAFIMGSATLLLNVKPKGVLAPLDSRLFLPEAVNPKAWPGGAIPFLDKDKTALPLAARYSSFVLVNTDLVKPGEVASFKDLLDPKWKGKITMYDPTISGSTSNWVGLILFKLNSFDNGRAYLQKFAAQEPVIIRDARLHAEWVARGRYPIGVGANFASTAELQAAKAPISWVNLSEGGLLAPGAGTFASPAKPAHPNAALVMANWLLTAPGQEAFSRAFGSPPVRLDASKEGFDRMAIPKPTDKVYWYDEPFAMSLPKAKAVGKEIFGPLMK